MKPQFTEEEFDDFYANCGRNTVGDYDYKVMKEKAVAKGYIRKSDLEILIEECDTLIKIYHSDNIGPWKRDEIILQQEKLIDLLKAELNKRRDI